MYKRPCFTTPFGSQRVNGSQKLLKSVPQHFYLIVLSIREKLSCKSSLLGWYEILGHFVKYVIVDDMYSRHNTEKTPPKIWQIVFGFLDIYIWITCVRFSLMLGIIVIGSQCVNKHS